MNLKNFFLRGKLPSNLKPSRALLTQLIGMLINLPVYVILLAIWDRRIAILGVRLWNRFLIFALTPILLLELSKYSGFAQFNLLTCILTSILFLGLFPGPFSPAVGNSLFSNFRTRNHIWNTGQINGIFRSFVLETVFPFFLIELILILSFFDFGKSKAFFILSVIFVLISSSLYAPMAICLCSLIALLNFEKFGITQAFIIIMILLCSLILIKLYIHGDEFGKEVLHEPISFSLFFKFGFWNIAEFFLVVLPPISFFIFDLISFKFFMILVILASFVFFNFTPNHNFSRIWFRGASPFYQLLVTYALIGNLHLSNLAISILLLFIFIIFSIFFYNQTLFLLDRDYFTNTSSINFVFLNRINSIESKNHCCPIMTIDAQEIMLLGLYSNVFAQNVPHGIGSAGFEEQLGHLAVAFKFLGRSKDEFLQSFRTEINYFEWLNLRRKDSIDDKLLLLISNYQLQFLCTYMTYNSALTSLGFRNSDGWTDDFFLHLESIWEG